MVIASNIFLLQVLRLRLRLKNISKNFKIHEAPPTFCALTLRFTLHTKVASTYFTSAEIRNDVVNAEEGSFYSNPDLEKELRNDPREDS